MGWVTKVSNKNFHSLFMFQLNKTKRGHNHRNEKDDISEVASIQAIHPCLLHTFQSQESHIPSKLAQICNTAFSMEKLPIDKILLAKCKSASSRYLLVARMCWVRRMSSRNAATILAQSAATIPFLATTIISMPLGVSSRYRR